MWVNMLVARSDLVSTVGIYIRVNLLVEQRSAIVVEQRALISPAPTTNAAPMAAAPVNGEEQAADHDLAARQEIETDPPPVVDANHNH
jgi:hypothetical protein